MSEKILNSRMIQKHDIETNWEKATNFIPKQGEIIVYDIDDNYDYARVKIGDGTSKVSDLPFIAEQAASSIINNIKPEDIGALDQENYYGIVRKEGEVVAAESLEGLAIGVTTFVESTVEGTPDVATDSIATITPVETVTVTRTGTNILDTKNCVYCYSWAVAKPVTLERTETGFKMTTGADFENSSVRMMAYLGTREELAGRTITVSADYASSVVDEEHNVPNFGFHLSSVYGGYNGTIGLTSKVELKQNVASVTGVIPNEGMDYVYATFYLGLGYTAPAGSTVEWSNIRVNVGDKDLGYEPYNGQVLTMTLPEAIYGGELNWTAGELTVTRVAYVVTGEENWTQSSSPTCRYNATIRNVPNCAAISDKLCPDVLCSHHVPTRVANSDGVWIINNMSSNVIQDNSIGMRWYDGAGRFGDNLTTFTDYLKAQYAAGTPVIYVYPVAAPYTIQLSPQELLAIDGTNTVWSYPGTTCADFNCTPFLKAIRPIVAITDEEIDSICETLWEDEDGVLVDEVTGKNYKLYVNNGDLKMTEVN